MVFLDATLSLAVGFCLMGGLFWLVRSPHVPIQTSLPGSTAVPGRLPDGGRGVGRLPKREARPARCAQPRVYPGFSG